MNFLMLISSQKKCQEKLEKQANYTIAQMVYVDAATSLSQPSELQISRHSVLVVEPGANPAIHVHVPVAVDPNAVGYERRW